MKTMNRILIGAVTLIACCGLAACSGGGSGDSASVNNTPPPPPPPPAVQTGVFKDFNVSGLSFVSGQESGITTDNGRFTCETGSDVAFSIGGVALGQTACATFVAPNQLATLGQTFDLEVSNLSRFLQMLDQDGDPDNGIVISDAVQQVSANWNQVDFLTADLDNELVTIISDAASVDGTLHALPSATEADEHLSATLACAYAGAYAGSFSGSNSGAAAMVIGWNAAGFGHVPLAFEWQGYDAADEFIVFGGGSGSITILDLPQIEHTAAGLAGPISAMFITPDSISGTWDGGNLNFQRIGPDDGSAYRLVGSAGSAEVAAYISVNLDDTSISGEAFEVVEGTTFSVTGTLTGDSVSLTATSATETLSGSGTLTRNADNSPREVQGTLDDGSTFSMVACRLN
ncbi:MAG: hypothetical protein KJO31_09735 [Gammaproteobacteria bacterium]|nr:hypothetical protein [Gammaproteobacteria bacterium]